MRRGGGDNKTVIHKKTWQGRSDKGNKKMKVTIGRWSLSACKVGGCKVKQNQETIQKEERGGTYKGTCHANMLGWIYGEIRGGTGPMKCE
jgi:hypothetical protein